MKDEAHAILRRPRDIREPNGVHCPQSTNPKRVSDTRIQRSHMDAAGMVPELIGLPDPSLLMRNNRGEMVTLASMYRSTVSRMCRGTGMYQLSTDTAVPSSVSSI